MLTTQQRTSPPVPPVASNVTIEGGETVTLTKAVQSPQGPLTSIRLREPTFGDWLDCGDWNMIIHHKDDDRAEIKIDPAAVGRWFQKLSNLPMAVIMQLSYQDGQDVYQALQRLVGKQRTGNSPTLQGSSG